MSLQQERADIEAYFKTQWETLHPTMTIGFDGHTFEPPPDGPSVKLDILDGDAAQRSFGSPGTNLVRNIGVIIFRIRVPGGQGTQTIRGYADQLMNLFRNKTIGVVRTRIPYVQTKTPENPLLGWSIAVPFYRDEFNA